MLRRSFLWMARRLIAGRNTPFLFNQQKPSFSDKLPKLGLYLHIPFCRQICPFCPYNKTLFDKKLSQKYISAVLQEFNQYKKILNQASFTSLYIGGGTPITLERDLVKIINSAQDSFGINNEVGIELHPNEIDKLKLSMLKSAGVTMVSLGIQSFQDKYLQMIGRNYDGQRAKDSFNKVLEYRFKTIDVDLLFALPEQKISDIKSDVRYIFQHGVDQLSCYPLIVFSFTQFPNMLKQRRMKTPNIFQEKRMFDEITKLADEYGYERTSIWTFTKKGSQRYTSVTREYFIGIGAGASSYIPGYFYINTFSLPEYIKASKTRLPIALTTNLTCKEQMAWWLFWRLYDGYIPKKRFNKLFDKEVDDEFNWLFRLLNILKLSRNENDGIRLTNMGAFLFQLIEQKYSLTYLNKTWSLLSNEAWPESLQL